MGDLGRIIVHFVVHETNSSIMKFKRGSHSRTFSNSFEVLP